jgi:hypothetical protein
VTCFHGDKIPRYGELAFATISGGPDHNSNVEHTYGYLESKLNANTDIEKNSVDFAQRLFYSTGSERSKIDALFTLAHTYQVTTLPYEPVPTSLSDGYNSSGYMRTLLNLVGIQPPTFVSPTFFFPGWQKPVPATFFGVQQ